VNGKYVPGTESEAAAMLAKGDLKFRLDGKRLKGDFALIHIRSRKSGSKGNEWLLIKKHDDAVEEGFDAGQYDTSVLTKRTMAQIGGDEKSDEWQSDRPAARGRLKAPWLAETLARVEKKKRQVQAGTGGAKRQKLQPKASTSTIEEKKTKKSPSRRPTRKLSA
jgi:bifunctional non-homologous end joining protein LigD